MESRILKRLNTERQSYTISIDNGALNIMKHNSQDVQAWTQHIQTGELACCPRKNIWSADRVEVPSSLSQSQMESIRRGFSTVQQHDSREGEPRLEQHIHQLTDVANIHEQVYVQTQGVMEGKQMVVRKTSPDIHKVQHQSHGSMFRTHPNLAAGHTTFKFLRSKS